MEIGKIWIPLVSSYLWAPSFRVDTHTHTNPRIIPLPDFGFLGEGLWSRRGDAAGATGMVGMVAVGGAGGTWKFGSIEGSFEDLLRPTHQSTLDQLHKRHFVSPNSKMSPNHPQKSSQTKITKIALRFLLCKFSTLLTFGRSAARRSKADLAGPLDCRSSVAFSTSSSGSESREGSKTAWARRGPKTDPVSLGGRGTRKKGPRCQSFA